MSYAITLAEVEAQLRKAARAVGLGWGMAEEAGKSARWLAAFALPGAELMLAHLQALQDCDYPPWAPDVEHEPWQAAGGKLCPVITGAALADRAAWLLEGRSIRLGCTAYPLLLVATLGQAARFHRTAFTASWDRIEVTCFGHDLAIAGDETALTLTETDSVVCRHDPDAVAQQHASSLAYSIDEESLAAIDALAYRTYAPATDESRAGAGAGLTDND